MVADVIAILSGEALRGALESLSHLVAFLGLPIALGVFVKNSISESKEKERTIYKNMQDQMYRINELCLSHPELDAGWICREDAEVVLTPEQKVQLYILFDMITSLFEDAYLVYGTASAKQRQRQWEGWEAYIRDYVARPDYKTWWLSFACAHNARVYSQYDREFENFMWSQFERQYSRDELLPEG